MKKKLLSKTFTKSNEKGKRAGTFKFNDDIIIDFNSYNKISFLLRKRLEFKAKDFNPRLVMNYYSNVIESEKAHLIFRYTRKKKPKARAITYDFLISPGTHTLEFSIPISYMQLNNIEICIDKDEAKDYNYLLRINDIYFKNY